MPRTKYTAVDKRRDESVKEYVDKYDKAPLVTDSRQLEELLQTLVKTLDELAIAYLEACQNLKEDIARIKELCEEEE